MLPLDEYIILDTETTGLSATNDRLIEIALCYVKDGEVLHQWQSLINPNQTIPSFVQSLTGITNALVKPAPLFEDIAENLLEVLHGRILVAHNARFDYSFLKNEFKRCGLNYQAKTLCSVKLSKKLFPQEKSHSLENISKRFNIKTKTRHRAMADIEVLQQFFQQLPQYIPLSQISIAIKDCLKSSSLPANISREFIQTIPNVPGVYQFYSDSNALLYIGKSVNLKDRVLSHFVSDHTSTSEQRMTQQVARIEWIETAGELGALLLEAQLIKKHQPIFNKKLRRTKILCGLKLKQSLDNYHSVELVSLSNTSIDEIHQLWGVFRSKRSAEEYLRKVLKEHSLCAKYLGLEKTKGSCFQYQLKICQGACANKITSDDYNRQLETALSPVKLQSWQHQTPLVIEELCHKTTRKVYHLVDKWCYIGSATNRDALKTLTHTNKPLAFDLDIYKIIAQYLTNTVTA